MIDFLGVFGSILFAVSYLPQVIKSVRQGHARGVSIWSLYLTLAGETSCIVYVLNKRTFPLLINYGCSFFFCTVLLFYKVFRD